MKVEFDEQLGNLERLIRGEGWKIVYMKDTTSNTPHWGVDSKEKIFFVFNTKDYRYVCDFFKNLRNQYGK